MLSKPQNWTKLIVEIKKVKNPKKIVNKSQFKGLLGKLYLNVKLQHFSTV